MLFSGFLFHTLLGSRGNELVRTLLLAAIGYVAGEVVAIPIGAEPNAGPFHAVHGLAGSWIFMTAAWWWRRRRSGG